MAKSSFDHPLLNQLNGYFAGLDRRLIIQMAVIVGLFALFVFGFFLPVLMQNQSSIAKVKELRMKIQSASAQVAQIPEKKAQKAEYEKELQEGRKKFFDPQEVDQIINVISATAGTAGVRITASSPTKETLEFPPPFNGMYSAIAYELTVEGPYHNIGLFLNDLETYRKAFSVYRCHVMKNDAEPAIRKCSLVLGAFIQKNKPTS